jgi:transposase
MHVIGEENSQRLDNIPAQYHVVVTHRPKYGCRACEGAIVQAPAPERLIKSGIPTEGLVASVVVDKFAWHNPLYRQAQIMKLQGLPVDRSTLAFWVRVAAAELKPVYLRMKEILLGSAKIAVDETRARPSRYSYRAFVPDRVRLTFGWTGLKSTHLVDRTGSTK